jgi:hypothetical protein
MPWSSSAGKQFISEYFNEVDPEIVVDVGPGEGTYSKLLRKPHQYWLAVEIWGPYISKYQLQNLYNKVVIADVVYWDPIFCDVCICGDVIEHLQPSDAKRAICKLKKMSNHLILSIPIGFCPQGEAEGNPYERHIDPHWTFEKVVAIAGYPHKFLISKDDSNIEIGVFIYHR